MREKAMIRDGSPCDTSFYPGGPMTVKAAKAAGQTLCPRIDQCRQDHRGGRSIQCLMKLGVEVARACLEGGHGIEEEMEAFRRDMSQIPTQEFVWSPDGTKLDILTDREDAFAKVGQFATMVMAV